MARGKFAHAYYPASYKKWRADFLKALGGHPLLHNTLPVTVDVAFLVTRPKTTKLLTPKGDIDNYVKSVLDALTDAGAWDDDKIVETLYATKRFAAPYERAGIVLTISPRQ